MKHAWWCRTLQYYFGIIPISSGKCYRCHENLDKPPCLTRNEIRLSIDNIVADYLPRLKGVENDKPSDEAVCLLKICIFKELQDINSRL